MRVLLSVALVHALVAFPGSALARAEPSDREIATAVELELMSQEVAIAHWLDAEARDGIVTLTGSVDSLLDVERALEVARATRGVRAVVSRIVVAPVERSDADLAREARECLRNDIATDDLDLRVEAEAGVVTLGGTVGSWQQQRFAVRVVAGVPGVRAVQDDLEVAYGAPRSDADIADDIRRRLRADVTVRHGLVEVEVRDGRATLVGFVGSAAEGARVRASAWVRGIRSLDASRLEVKPWAHDAMKRFQREPLSDEEIRAAIRDALLYDPRISEASIEVEVEDGVALLSGVVATALARREAQETASNTTGVVRVTNLIKVRPPRAPAGDLVARVRQALSSTPRLGDETIEITERRGRVYLDGWVDSVDERRRAVERVEGLPGVIEVRSRLDVPRSHHGEADAEIQGAIEEQLYWDAEVDEASVEVRVEDGIATLTGVVGDRAQRTRAAENAFEGGAAEVRNRLRVRGFAPDEAPGTPRP